MDQFIYYSGITLWILVLLRLILPLIVGKNWVLKIGSWAFFGSGLVRSSKKLIKEVKKRDVSDDTAGEFVAHIIWRITRIGMFAILIGLIPFALLYQQNQLINTQNELFQFQNKKVEMQTVLDSMQTELLIKQNTLFQYQNLKVSQQTEFLEEQTGLFRLQNQLLSGQNMRLDTQNYRLNLQNNLIEAGRRGALVILMSDIMNQMNQEILVQKNGVSNYDSLSYSLSDPLIGRIAALSQGFLPYRYLDSDTLVEKAVSLERGQLLLALLKSKLDLKTYDEIYASADFLKAYLAAANLKMAYLKKAKLHGAYLKGANLNGGQLQEAILRHSNLSGANLNKAYLGGADLRDADLTKVNLVRANLINTNLNGASLVEADLRNAILTEANFTAADLSRTSLRGADLSRAVLLNADLNEADLSRANLSGTIFSFARNLKAAQLKQVRTLYQCRGLEQKLEQKLRQEKECLFTERGCI